MKILIEIIGWIGSALIVLAYYLTTHDKIEGESRVAQMINLCGAIGLGINVFYRQAWPSFGLQIVWGAIAIVALLKNVKNKKQKSP